MSHPALRPLSFSEILDGAFKLYRRHFVAMISTALIAIGPMVLLWGAAAPQMTALQDPEVFDGGAVGAVFVAVAATMLFFGVMYVALTRLFSQAYMGGEVSVADAYRVGLRRFFPALVSWMVIFAGWLVAFFGLMLVVGVIVGIASLGASVGGQGMGAVTIALFVVLVVVGLVLIVALYAVLAALSVGVLSPIVIERKGPLEAIGRWVGLARGAFVKMMALATVTVMLVMLPTFGVLVLSGMMRGVWAGDPSQTSAAAFWAQQVVSSLVGALTYPFMIAAFVLLYYDRRVRVEALDVEMATEGLEARPERVEV